MHPIERLRYVARASGADQRVLVSETASALRGLGMDPAGLVTSARRIVERHPTAGALWWLCARVLTAAEPYREAARCVEEIESDPTADLIIETLADDATVVVLGWPDLAGEALLRRGDPTVLIVDVGDHASSYLRRLERADVAAELISPASIGAAVAAADLVLVETSAVSAEGAVCTAGSRAAASVAYCSEVPVWLVAGVGRRLPIPMWQHLADRLVADTDPWDLDDEVVPIGLFSAVAGPNGIAELAADTLAPECPLTHELLKPAPF
jgi:hypothetical protein